jgi:hypothetical protein
MRLRITTRPTTSGSFSDQVGQRRDPRGGRDSSAGLPLKHRPTPQRPVICSRYRGIELSPPGSLRPRDRSPRDPRTPRSRSPGCSPGGRGSSRSRGRRSWSVWKGTSERPRSDSRRHRVEIGRGPVRVARAGEGRSHDRCPRRAWNRWHHRLDRSCACGPVFREALNHVSGLGPERPGSPRSFLNLPRSTKARLARRAGPSDSCVGRSVTRPSTGPTPGRHRCRPRRPHASHPPFDLSGRTEAARSPAW